MGRATLMAGVTGFDGRTYQQRFDQLADEGVDVHGEATFVRSFEPRRVLDAGCGTGRVAIELDRHGVEVVGVDFDASMIAEAKRRAPHLQWIQADVSELELDSQFDLVVMAGNVPLFCPRERRAALVGACARHLQPEGRLIAGFQLAKDLALTDYDRFCDDAGLVLESRWATWDRTAFDAACDYAVSVHLPAT